jgi:hypothetical protein
MLLYPSLQMEDAEGKMRAISLLMAAAECFASTQHHEMGYDMALQCALRSLELSEAVEGRPHYQGIMAFRDHLLALIREHGTPVLFARRAYREQMHGPQDWSAQRERFARIGALVRGDGVVRYNASESSSAATLEKIRQEAEEELASFSPATRQSSLDAVRVLVREGSDC